MQSASTSLDLTEPALRGRCQGLDLGVRDPIRV